MKRGWIAVAPGPIKSKRAKCEGSEVSGLPIAEGLARIKVRMRQPTTRVGE